MRKFSEVQKCSFVAYEIFIYIIFFLGAKGAKSHLILVYFQVEMSHQKVKIAIILKISAVRLRATRNFIDPDSFQNISKLFLIRQRGPDGNKFDCQKLTRSKNNDYLEKLMILSSMKIPRNLKNRSIWSNVYDGGIRIRQPRHICALTSFAEINVPPLN